MPAWSVFLVGLTAALVVLALPWTAAHLLRSLETARPLSDPAELKRAQVIVVLGSDYVGFAPELGGDTVGPMTLQRLHYAARLCRESGVPLLVTGGEIGRGGRSLATCMDEVLRHDFQVQARWTEHRARNTSENVAYSAELLRAEGIDEICVVTHAFHMHRAARAFRRAGFKVTAAPTMSRARPRPLARDFKPDSGSLYRSLVALREWVSRGNDAWRGVMRPDRGPRSGP